MVGLYEWRQDTRLRTPTMRVDVHRFEVWTVSSTNSWFISAMQPADRLVVAGTSAQGCGP